jgi:ribosomal protein L16/L10AE
MLMPKRVKYRKMHRGNNRGMSHNGPPGLPVAKSKPRAVPFRTMSSVVAKCGFASFRTSRSP